MPRHAFRASVMLVCGLLVVPAVPAFAALPPPLRLAAMFERAPWGVGEQGPGPVPPGRIVIEWSRDGSS